MGGADHPSNLVWACYDCNTRKKTHPIEIFRKYECHRWKLDSLMFCGETDEIWDSARDMPVPNYEWRSRQNRSRRCKRCRTNYTQNRNEICTQCQNDREAELMEINFL